MLVYVVALGLSFLLARYAEVKNGAHLRTTLPRVWNVPALTVAFVLIAISALRWGVGTDYWNYHVAFPQYAREFTEEFSIFGEPGLRFFAWIGLHLNNDSATMFALASLVTIGLTVRTLWKWSPAFAFSVALYILMGAWSGSFNGIRQYLACALLFAGHRYIIDRKIWKWLLVVLFGMLFHVSSIAAFFLYFLPTKRTSVGMQAVILILGFIGMLSFGTLLDVVTEQSGETRWDGSYANQAVNPLRVAFAFVPLVLYWLLANRRAIARHSSWFQVNMLAVYAAAYLTSATSALMARFAIYALPFVILGLVAVTSVESKRERFVIRAVVLMLYGGFFYIDTFAYGNAEEFRWLFERT